MPLGSPGPERRLVILEPSAEGHPREWLQHLMRFTASLGGPYVVWFVVAPALCRGLAAEMPAALTDRVRLISLRPIEEKLCMHRWLPVSGFARWWTMRRYLLISGAEAGHFLSLDHLSLPLALGLGAAGRRLGGILFRPTTHYRSLGPYHPRGGERVRDLRKAILYRLMLLNHAVRAVLTLDPYFPGHAAQHYRGGEKVMAVPDPAHPPINATMEDVRLAGLIPPNRVAFVLFGFLTERKGVLALLDSLRMVPDSAASRIAIMVAGKVDNDIRDEVTEMCRRLAVTQPHLWLHVEDRRLSSGEIDALVRRSDVVLAPYQRFAGSSGVMMWAARAGKPLLTQEFGLIGRLVRDYELGIALDTSNPRTLAYGIERMTVRGPLAFINRRSAQDFAAARTPQHFATAVFAGLLRE